MHRCVTKDETLVHHFDPEAKTAENAIEAPWLTPPKGFKKIPSVGKVMASIFWDSQGVIVVDYLKEGRALNG